MLAPDSKLLRSWERMSWSNCSPASERTFNRVVCKALFSDGSLVADRAAPKSVLVLSVWPGYAAAWNLKITRVPSTRDPIAGPPRGERLLASGDLHPPQLVAGNFVLFECSLIGRVRQALGGDHTRSRAASYTFRPDESGNLSIAVVVRHDLPSSRDNSERGALWCVPLNSTGSAHSFIELLAISQKPFTVFV